MTIEGHRRMHFQGSTHLLRKLWEMRDLIVSPKFGATNRKAMLSKSQRDFWLPQCIEAYEQKIDVVKKRERFVVWSDVSLPH